MKISTFAFVSLFLFSACGKQYETQQTPAPAPQEETARDNKVYEPVCVLPGEKPEDCLVYSLKEVPPPDYKNI